MSAFAERPNRSPVRLTQRENILQDKAASLRFMLKTQLQPYHDRLEAALAVLLRPLTVLAYHTLLARLYGIYLPLETELASVLTPTVSPLDFSRRRKGLLLERDLQTLGLTSTDVLALPQCSFVPTCPTLAHALGCLYVLEGATLGGQVISRHVHAHFGFTRAHGCAFFQRYGEDVGSMLQEFCAVLTGTLTTTAQQEAAVSSACVTFAAFERWLREACRQPLVRARAGS